MEALANSSAEAVEWVSATAHVELRAVSQLGGHSRPRTHREPEGAPGAPPKPVGFDIMKGLRARVDALVAAGVVQVMTGMRVLELQRSADGAVRGLLTSPTAAPGTLHTFGARSVVLATGGFSADGGADSLLTEFAPRLAGLPTTNGPWATGDGVRLARAVGAGLVGMEHVQVRQARWAGALQRIT